MPDQYGYVRSERKDIVGSITEPYLISKKDRTLMQQYERISPGSDGRIRTTLSSVGTETSRLSSSESFVDPASTNLQNISKSEGFRDDLYRVRDVVIADPGMLFWANDYDKAEAVCAAVYSKDWDFYHKLIEGEDIHTWHAAHFFGHDSEDQVTKIQRQVAKMITYACVPTNTEILTPEGWKLYSEVEPGDRVMGFDPDKNELVWDILRAVNIYEDADLVRYSNRTFSIVCTPNHDWYVRRNERDWNHGDDYRYYKEPIVAGKGGYDLVLSAPFREGEGLSRIENRDFGEVSISQVLKMTPDQRQAFLLGAVTADGWQMPHRVGPSICQSEKKFLDEYALAIFLEGFRPRLHPHSASEHVFNVHGQQPTVGSVCLKTDPAGRGRVWCPTTDTGYWVMRQGREIALTGNSNYKINDFTLMRKLNDKADQTGVKLTQDQAGELKRAYLDLHPLEEWWASVEQELNSKGHIINAFGLKRTFYNPNEHKRLKEALAYLPQSTVACAINESMIRIYNELDQTGRTQLLLQVHDELMGQAPVDTVEQISLEVQEIMETPFEVHGREVYIPAGRAIGRRWGTYRDKKTDPDNNMERLVEQ